VRRAYAAQVYSFTPSTKVVELNQPFCQDGVMKQKDGFALFYAGWPIAFIAKQPMAAEQTTRRRLVLPVQVNAEFDPSKKKTHNEHARSYSINYDRLHFLFLRHPGRVRVELDGEFDNERSAFVMSSSGAG
jgi:hypothetical protein